MARSERQSRDAGRGQRAATTREQTAAVAASDAGYRDVVAPTTVAPQWKQRRYVERRAELDEAAAYLRQARVVALDAEFSQVRVRGPNDPSHRLALLQLASDDEYDTSYVIDAHRLADLSPLEPVFDDPAILTLFHGIGADARVLATRGLIAHNTLDLEAVSRSIFGQRESGLQAMLQRACGIRLDKSLQRADWSKRPLTQAMLTYAARDAEMTFVLYGWLTTHYSWAVALHETIGDEAPPPVAAWIAPYLEGSRPKPAPVAVMEAGIADDAAAQEEALRSTLAVVRHPNQRARVMRLITDLELKRLAPDLRPYLISPASEERAGAARGIGRLHDKRAINLVRPLLDDPVHDVRQAARLALEALTGSAPPLRRNSAPPAEKRAGPVKWTSGSTESDDVADSGWQAVLRSTFGLDTAESKDESGGDARTPVGPSEKDAHGEE
jgi:hypothetical protein